MVRINCLDQEAQLENYLFVRSNSIEPTPKAVVQQIFSFFFVRNCDGHLWFDYWSSPYDNISEAISNC